MARCCRCTGLAVVGAGKCDAALFVAETVVVGQAVMIVTSLLAMKVAAGRGHRLVMLISFKSLPLRGFLAGTFIVHWGVWPVQALDGIGAGLQSVAIPGLVACLLRERFGRSRGRRVDVRPADPFDHLAPYRRAPHQP